MTGDVMAAAELDAWAQLDALHERFTREWVVRRDLRVRALAAERCVEFGLGEMADGKMPGHPSMQFKVTRRNVGTMRELAAALTEACAFVDQSNPKWAALP